jgi:hypothetical protein
MPKVVNNIGRATSGIKAASEILSERAARSHVAVSKQLAPVRTGFLRDNIYAERVALAVWTVISAALYSAYVEFEQPFFLPGYESAQRQLREEAAQVVVVQLLQAGIR